MADEEKTTVSRPVEPVQVAIIGTGDGRGLPTGTEAVTDGAHQPNLIVTVIGPARAVTIRFVNTFFTVMLGIMTGALTTNVIPANDFLHLLYKCAGLSIAGAGIGLLKDLVTVFSGLEKKFPLATGSV